jgi:hypothetical protein
MLHTTALLLSALLAAEPAALTKTEDPNWQRVKLDDAFRSEGAAVADVNQDGKPDVLVGDLWYEAPDWKIHEIRKPGSFKAGIGYSQSFAMWTHDVNEDGWADLIHVGFPGAPCHWYENPKNEPGHWKEHVVWHSACNETPDFEDVTGDGRPELLLGSQPESQVGYLPLPKVEDAGGKWDFTPVGEKGDPGKNGSHHFYHGLGVGDLNGDQRTDVIIPHGWWEQPAAPTGEPWTFHPLTLLKDGKPVPEKVSNIYVEDLDLDGDADMMFGSAHAYGVWWLENVSEDDANEASKFVYHLIDDSYSQTHAMEYVDLNGDGRRELVTGKRFYAHNGHDPGGRDPVMMFRYDIERTKGQPPRFTRHEIIAGKDTGVGTQFTTADMNADGHLDIVLSNKKGVNILLQTPAE